MRGDLLQMRREEMKLSRDQLAARVGISYDQIRRYELGESSATDDVLLKISEVLECSTDYLLGKESAQKPVYRMSDLSAEEQRLIVAYRRGDFPGALRVLAESNRNGSTEAK